MKWRNAFGDVSGCSCFFTFYYAKGGDVAQILYAMKYHARKNFVAGWVNIWLENCVIPAF